MTADNKSSFFKFFSEDNEFKDLEEPLNLFEGWIALKQEQKQEQGSSSTNGRRSSGAAL